MSFIDPQKRKIRFSGIDKESISKLSECGSLAEEKEKNIPVPPPNPCDSFSLTETHSNNDIWEGANGSISIVVNGGTPDFLYVWSNGKTTKDISDLAPGTYSLTATDSNGCTAQISVTIEDDSSEPEPHPGSGSAGSGACPLGKEVHFCSTWMSGAKTTGPVYPGSKAINVPRPGERPVQWYGGEETTWWKFKGQGQGSAYDYVGSFPVDTANKINDYIGEGEFQWREHLPNTVGNGGRVKSIYVPPGTRFVISEDRAFSDESKKWVDVVGPALLYGLEAPYKRNSKNGWATGQHIPNANLAHRIKFGEYTDCVGVGYDKNCWAINLLTISAISVFTASVFFKITYDENPRTPFFKYLGNPNSVPADFSHLSDFAFTFADWMTIIANYDSRNSWTGQEYYTFWTDDTNQEVSLMVFCALGWRGGEWRYWP